jgi:GNAT superfamily N-acetyltransferase
VRCRAPREEDEAEILQMWEELREASGRQGPLAPLPSSELLHARLTALSADPTCRLIVAEGDGALAGMACLAARPLGPFVEAPVLQIDYLHIRPGQRGRGVGRALVAAAASFADELGLEHVSVSVFPHLREANRFYARLGFSPLVVRRVATTSTVRRRLGLEPTSGRLSVLARRRSVRARAAG